MLANFVANMKMSTDKQNHSFRPVKGPMGVPPFLVELTELCVDPQFATTHNRPPGRNDVEPLVSCQL